jgi:hypothetical protein
MQDSRPDADDGIGYPARPRKDPVRQIPVRCRRRLCGAQCRGWRLDDDRARQIMDLLGEEMTHLGWDQDRIGEQIIHRWQAGARRMSPGAHLDRRGLARKGAKPIASRVSGQVDQDVDLVGADAIGELIVGPLQNASPPVGYIPERTGHLVLGRKAGIADNLEPRFVVVLEYRPERISR